MDIKEARKIVEGEIYLTDGRYAPYIDINNAYDDECEKFICAIEVLLNELDKKDKIIIAMAEQLTTPVHGIDWVIDYFTKKVEGK